ncbi:MAG: hypothetical protein JWQ06_2536 [Mucilaginibacter sp.]|jgi:hypothetical protein|nr:hypothetical protein [Mucilaginibacter sp.]
MKFLDFLFVAIFVIYLIRSLVRIVLPMLFQSVINKAQQGQQQNYQRPNKSADSVKVDYIPQSKKNTVPDTEGEFVDYEEIK